VGGDQTEREGGADQKVSPPQGTRKTQHKKARHTFVVFKEIQYKIQSFLQNDLLYFFI
jgi:hypothetical protein